MHVSVVIPSRNRPDLAAAAVDSVLANRHPPFDVVVVDQSDDDRTAERLRPTVKADARLTYLPSATRGASRARNLGAAHARGDVVAFLDDDCTAPLDWIGSIVAAFERHPDVDLLYGQVRRARALEGQDGVVPTLEFDAPRRVSRSQGFEIVGMSANLAVRRDRLERLGGFDALLGPGSGSAGGEDFDFEYRALLDGATLLLEPSVVVDHFGRRDSTEWPRLLHAYGLGDGAFYAKHIRCGDSVASRALAIRLLRLGAREALNTTGLRRRPSQAPYLRGCVEGMLGSWRWPVDRQRRLYVTTGDAGARR